MSGLFPYLDETCESDADGTAVQHYTDPAGQVPDGVGGYVDAVDVDGTPIGPDTPVVSFYAPDGTYLNSWQGNVDALLPPGGTTGQALVKSSNSDYDANWVTGGAGGDKFETASFTNEQVWTMIHTMGRTPAVHTIDEFGEEIHSTVEYPTPTRVDVTHSVSRTGTMILT